MMRATTFNDVIYNLDDQVIVRQLLLKYVPSDVRSMIVDEFNEHVDQYNARREQGKDVNQNKPARIKGLVTVPEEDVIMAYPHGVYNIGSDQPDLIAPCEIRSNDIIYICPFCGIVKVTRSDAVVYHDENHQQNHKAFIDPADWRLLSGSTETDKS